MQLEQVLNQVVPNQSNLTATGMVQGVVTYTITPVNGCVGAARTNSSRNLRLKLDIQPSQTICYVERLHLALLLNWSLELNL
jgi:hypothetical protein